MLTLFDRKFRIVDLSQPFGHNIPLWPNPEMPDIIIERVAYHERDPKLSTMIKTKMHVSTHTDAPIHVLPEGITIDKVPLETFIGPGVVVSIPTKKWEVITAKHLEAAEPKIQKGDFVVINTGWHKLYRVNNYAYMNHYGGMYREAGEWFVEKGVKAVGVDQPALDHPCAHRPMAKLMPKLAEEYRMETGKDPDEVFPEYEPCHKLLLGHGIAGYEGVGGDIDQVTGKRCIIAGFPIRFEQGDGSLVRLVALVEED